MGFPSARLSASSPASPFFSTTQKPSCRSTTVSRLGIGVGGIGEDEEAAVRLAHRPVLARGQLEHARAARLRAFAEEALGRVRFEHGRAGDRGERVEALVEAPEQILVLGGPRLAVLARRHRSTTATKRTGTPSMRRAPAGVRTPRRSRPRRPRRRATPPRRSRRPGTSRAHRGWRGRRPLPRRPRRRSRREAPRPGGRRPRRRARTPARRSRASRGRPGRQRGRRP